MTSSVCYNKYKFRVVWHSLHWPLDGLKKYRRISLLPIIIEIIFYYFCIWNKNSKEFLLINVSIIIYFLFVL